MNETVEAETGFRTCGIMYLGETEAELAQLEGWLEHARAIPARHAADRRRRGRRAAARAGQELGRRALHRRATARASRRWRRRRSPRRRGRRAPAILTNCAVRGIETAAGRVSRRSSPRRGRIACQSVVLAGGAWSRLFCGNLGVELPQLKVLGSVMRTETLSMAARRSRPRAVSSASASGWTAATTFRPLGAAMYRHRAGQLSACSAISCRRSSCTGEAAASARPPLRRGVAHAAALGARRADAVRGGAHARSRSRPVPCSTSRTQHREAFPAFRDMPIAERWGGMIDVTPDAIPVISAVESVPGFFIATGFSGHGFGIGPGAGRLIADMVTGDADRGRSGAVPPSPASPTARTRSRTRWRADRGDYPAAASFCRSCAMRAATCPPLRWITEANSSRWVTFMLTPAT